MAEADQYDDKTKEQLHDELAERGLPVSGSKEELADRLRDDDKQKADTGNSASPEATADPAASGGGAPAAGQSTTPELGGEPLENADKIQGNDSEGFDTTGESRRGGRQAIDYERTQAEKEERENIVEFENATYKSDEPHFLREIAEKLGLTRQEDYSDLVALNNRPLEARVDAGEEIRLPNRYSYVDVDDVTGGAVKK